MPQKYHYSIKINGFCPAVKTDDKVLVTVISTHIGHKEDLRACHLNKDEKDEIAKKLASGVPVQRILHDIRDSYTI